MDIFVMPSLTETTSLATLEAMSCGLPVIATKVGFIKNYLVKDHNGLFFPRNKSTVLALKLQKLIDNKELREKLGKNARKTIAYSFSWERSINKIKRILLKHIVEES
jgi:L-malate glycosyltransferase